MMKIMDYVDVKKIKKYLTNGLLLCQFHPSVPNIVILNYSRKVQFENLWDELTLLCRGLIINIETGKIIARPFLKFFNYEQLKPEEIPLLPFEAYEKMDGSLGILYWLNNNPYIASRGSFASDQANHANDVLYSRYQHVFDKLNKSATYLFEIIYPENRIVVDYGDKDDLVLLAVIDNVTGNDLPLEDIGFEIVMSYDGINDYTLLRTDNDMYREGYIIKFSNGFRMKMKYEEYCRLHSVVTMLSNVIIWEYLSQEKSFDELLDKTPDEYDSFIKKTAEELNNKFRELEYKHITFISDNMLTTPKYSSRKEQAEVILSSKGYNTKILFDMLDGKNYNKVIWSMIRPIFAKPFMNHVEEF